MSHVISKIYIHGQLQGHNETQLNIFEHFDLDVTKR